MKNRILSVRLSEDERNDQRGDEPAVPDIILIRNQYPDAAALHRVLDYMCRSGMIGGYALHTDSAHCHLHLVVNSVSFEDGKKHFSGFHDLFPVRDFLQECFPRSNVHIYQSFPASDVNRFGCSDDDELLRID